VIAVQCVHAMAPLTAESGTLSPIARLKNAFLSVHESEQATCLAAGQQCWGSAGSACSGTNGCCGQCCSGLVCGGTADDNAYWKGCRAPNSGAQISCGASPSPSPAPAPAPAPAGSGTAGTTTRYWDCCKASCSWPAKAAVNFPVGNCAKDGISVIDANTASACNGGSAYMCTSNQPVVISSSLALGFAAASIAGETEADWCSACYELTFTSGPVSGNRLVVQVTNTGSDLGAGHFDLQFPGGGVGIFDGCTSQWGAPSTGWGAQYGGVSSVSQCSQLPSALQPGCQFRFGWFGGSDNPTMTFRRVKCPAQLVSKSGSRRNDDSSYSLASGTS